MSKILQNIPAKKLHQTLTMIYPFYYISMVFSLNDRSVKSFVQQNRLLNKIVCSVKKRFFQKFVLKNSLFSKKLSFFKKFVPKNRQFSKKLFLKARSKDFKSFFRLFLKNDNFSNDPFHSFIVRFFLNYTLFYIQILFVQKNNTHIL